AEARPSTRGRTLSGAFVARVCAVVHLVTCAILPTALRRRATTLTSSIARLVAANAVDARTRRTFTFVLALGTDRQASRAATVVYAKAGGALAVGRARRSARTQRKELGAAQGAFGGNISSSNDDHRRVRRRGGMIGS